MTNTKVIAVVLAIKIHTIARPTNPDPQAVAVSVTADTASIK